jgi:hypothetical protein
MNMIRIYTSMDDELYDRFEKYNKDHPGREIEPTKILRAEINRILKTEGY